MDEQQQGRVRAGSEGVAVEVAEEEVAAVVVEEEEESSGAKRGKQREGRGGPRTTVE